MNILVRLTKNVSVVLQNPKLILFFFLSPLFFLIAITPAAVLLYGVLGNFVLNQSDILYLFRSAWFWIAIYSFMVLSFSLIYAVMSGFIYLNSDALNNHKLRIFRCLGRGLGRLSVIVPFFAVFLAVAFLCGFILSIDMLWLLSYILISMILIFLAVAFCGLIFIPFVFAYENNSIWCSCKRSIRIFLDNILFSFLLTIFSITLFLVLGFINSMILKNPLFPWPLSLCIAVVGHVGLVLFKMALFLTLTSLYHESVNRLQL